MKKYLFLIILLMPFFLKAQLSVFIDAAKDYNDANIVNNNSRQVTPFKVNTTFSKVLDALKYIDTANMFNQAFTWNIKGNGGTIDGTHFIGTTDNAPFNIRVNNEKAGRIDFDVFKGNTFYGYKSGNSITGAGQQNVAFGYEALLSTTTSSGNGAFGINALRSNTTGYQNTAIGSSALYSNNTGTGNTSVGVLALSNNISGDYNTAIGYATSTSAGTLNNTTCIGAKAYASASNSLILGSINGTNGATADTKVGIGITAPTERLHIVGNLRLVNGSEGVGKFLKSDANGLSTWADLPAETGTVSSVSVENANGFSGTVANATTTPAITIQTTINGLIKGNGTAILAAVANTDYATPAYADAKVADEINNGVTAIAPSQNAVFDALALKQDNIGYTPENEANKENVTINNNATKYPTINLLKTGLDTKFTKGGDDDIADLAIGTNAAQNFFIKTDNTNRMSFNTSGDIGIGTINPLFKLHIWGPGGNGSGGKIGFGDDNSGDPRVSFGERGNTDSDQGYLHANQGVFIGAGTYNSAVKLSVKTTGTIIGGETPVGGNELTVVGNSDISGNLNVQGNLTANNIISFSGVLDFPSTTAGTSSELTIAVAGAAVGDAIAPGIPTSNANSMYEYRVSAANVVTVKFNNYSSGSINPVSSTFKGKILK